MTDKADLSGRRVGEFAKQAIVSPMLRGPYRVIVACDPHARAGGWSVLPPSGERAPVCWYSLQEIALLELLAGLGRVVHRLLVRIGVRPEMPGPVLPEPWLDRACMWEQVERWGKRAGVEWARAHARKRYQRVLDDRDIVIEYLAIDVAAAVDYKKRGELFVGTDLID